VESFEYPVDLARPGLHWNSLQSPLLPLGPGYSQQEAPSQGWIAIAVPAIVDQATFDAAQVRLEQNKQLAKRHNTTHNYLLRGLVWCGQCQRSCHGRTDHLGYSYYLCGGRLERLKPDATAHCTARYIPVADLDALVWQDVCQVQREPTLITHELERARAGEWLPQALHARQKTVNDALAQLERQLARLLDLYLSGVIEHAVFERKHHDLSAQQEGLHQQQRQLEAQVQHHLDVVKLTDSITTFCTRLQTTLDQLDFAQQRQLVELLVDCVIVSDEQVEIHYVIPTGPQGEATIFRHLRSDYLDSAPGAITLGNIAPLRASMQFPKQAAYNAPMFRPGMATLGPGAWQIGFKHTNLFIGQFMSSHQNTSMASSDADVQHILGHR
jgi:site-specific DNA recombinase